MQRSAKNSSSTVEKPTIETTPDLRIHDPISYRTPKGWSIARVMMVKPTGVVAVSVGKDVLRLEWSEVFPPF
jgi:uncharacterized Fe-S cluster-containing MiaB family protein